METRLNSFSCELCNKGFSQKSSRNRHVKEKHTQPGQYQCQQCGLRFSKKYNLQMHVKQLHSNVDVEILKKQHKCSHCPGLFTNLATLKRHAKHYHAEIGMSESSSKDYAKETDAQTIAETVLEELKQLQNAMQTTKGETSNVNTELTDIEMPTVKYITIRDNLYPLGHSTVLKVQTIERGDNLKYLICEFCSKEFRKTYNFLRHRRIHTKIRPFICVLCKKSFPTIAQLKLHAGIHKLNATFGILHKVYKYPQCHESFNAMQHLDKHLGSSLTCCSVSFNCPQCAKSFKTLKSLLRHGHREKDAVLELLKSILPLPTVEEKCIETDIYNCTLCDLPLRDTTLCKQHEKRHENLFKHKCGDCQQSYATAAALNVHIKQIHFKCQYCRKSFKTKQNCRNHMMGHLKVLIKTQESCREPNETLLMYPTMLATQPTTATLIIKNHQKPKPPREEKRPYDAFKYKCSLCDKTFRFNAWLRKHFKYKHLPELKYECNKCLKKFSSKQSMEHHVATLHEAQRGKLSCQVCGRQYACSKSLKLHLRIHTQEKPFACDKCPKLFRTSGHRIQHQKSHNRS